MSTPDRSELPEAHASVQLDALDGSVADRFAAERAAIAELDHQPLSEHPEVFAQLHGQLQAALAEIDGI